MKRRRLMVGDLCRYNAAGMRNKTLGIVLDVKRYTANSGEYRRVLLIHWVTTDRLLPRHSSGWSPNHQHAFSEKHIGYGVDKPKNPIAWYDEGDYLECANLE
jgi:hypothetical protein